MSRTPAITGSELTTALTKGGETHVDTIRNAKRATVWQSPLAATPVTTIHPTQTTT
jgi:hypothetical protein